MSELKTLKDMVEIVNEEDWQKGVCFADALRKAAIDWIIGIQKKIAEHDGDIDDMGFDRGMRIREEGEAIIGWIMAFFNLTEDDVKR